MVTVEEVRLEIIPLQQRGSPDSANHAANANREESMSVVSEKPSDDGYSSRKYGQRGSPDSANHAANASREENMSVTSKKPSSDGHNWQKYGQRESPDSSKHAANVTREENFPVVPEKPSEDGYNWRKYGQKNIKGNKHIRSYYRCSYQKCLVKKQVERAPDGRITDTSYFGLHDHPKPQTGLGVELPSIISMKVQTGDKHSSLVAKEKPSSAHAHALTTVDAELMETDELTSTPITVEGTHDLASPSSVSKDYRNSDDFVASKRRKTGDDYDMSMDNKPKSRWVVETISAVDIISDGYRWRKYGQKLVKDNPNARSYYRCTNPGCPAKKRVERASHDPKLVITTYEGHHDHDVPLGRILLPHSSSPAASIASSHNIVKTEDAMQAQNTAVMSEELGKTTDHANEKYNTPKQINQSHSSAVNHKQRQISTDHSAEKDNPLEEFNHAQSSQEIGQGNTINHQVEKDSAEEVNHVQSSTGIEQGNTIDHPGKKDSAAEVKEAEIGAPVCKQEQEQEQDKNIDIQPKDDDPPEEVDQAESREPICKRDEGKTIVLPTKMDDQPEEVNQAQSSAPICKQDQGKTIDLPTKKDDQPEVNQAESSVPICKQDQGKTIDLPTTKDDPPEEVNQAENSAPVSKQDQGKTIDLPTKKDDPPEEVNQAQYSAAVCNQEEGNTIDNPAEKVNPLKVVDQAQSIATSCIQEEDKTTDQSAEETSHQMI